MLLDNCATCIALQGLFALVVKPAHPKEFSGIGKSFPGQSDVPSGVQWSYWHRRHKVPMLAVNLEGMEDQHGGWPIGRLIDRELARPLIPSVAAKFRPADDVDLWFGYDIWSPVRGKLRSDDLLDTTAYGLTKETWLKALTDARHYQNREGTGRTRQMVKLKSGKTRELSVSPHMNVTTTVWGTMPGTHAERLKRFEASRDLLLPLYNALKSQVNAEAR